MEVSFFSTGPAVNKKSPLKIEKKSQKGAEANRSQVKEKK